MLKDMEEKAGECIACGKVLTMLVGDTLMPITNSQYEAELSKRPDFRIYTSHEESCILCGSAREPFNAEICGGCRW